MVVLREGIVSPVHSRYGEGPSQAWGDRLIFAGDLAAAGARLEPSARSICPRSSMSTRAGFAGARSSCSAGTPLAMTPIPRRSSCGEGSSEATQRGVPRDPGTVEAASSPRSDSRKGSSPPRWRVSAAHRRNKSAAQGNSLRNPQSSRSTAPGCARGSAQERGPERSRAERPQLCGEPQRVAAGTTTHVGGDRLGTAQLGRSDPVIAVNEKEPVLRLEDHHGQDIFARAHVKPDTIRVKMRARIHERARQHILYPDLGHAKSMIDRPPPSWLPPPGDSARSPLASPPLLAHCDSERCVERTAHVRPREQ
jgi:hypothetical protein